MVEISLDAPILPYMIYYLTKVALKLAKTIPSLVKKMKQSASAFFISVCIIFSMPQRSV